MNYQNTTVVLTGATGGIGREVALLLAYRGATLLLVGRNADMLEELCHCLKGVHHYTCADIATESGREQVINWATQLGATVLINNAGVSQFDAIDNITEQAFREAMEVNVMAPVCLTKTFLKKVATDRSRIVVNVGSALGSIGFPFYTSYCASKFALRGFTEALGRELAGSTDKVLYFAPRATQTNMNNANVRAMNEKLGNSVDSPGLVAKALIHQLDKGARRSGIGFPEQLIAKLNGLLPWVVDRVMSKKLENIRQFVQTNR